MTLKDIILTIFDKRKEPLSKQEIIKNIFIINQHLSVLYPIEIAELNSINTNSVAQYYYWRSRLGNTKKIPKKIWTKPNKNIDNKKSAKIDNNIRKIFMSYYNLDRKDMDYVMDKYADFVNKVFKEIAKTIK